MSNVHGHVSVMFFSAMDTRGVVVTEFVVSTKLIYVEPG